MVDWTLNGNSKTPPVFGSQITWREAVENLELWLDGCEIPADRALPTIFSKAFHNHPTFHRLSQEFKRLFPNFMKLKPRKPKKGEEGYSDDDFEDPTKPAARSGLGITSRLILLTSNLTLRYPKVPSNHHR